MVHSIRLNLPVDAPLLWEAAYHGNIHSVKSLLSTGADYKERASDTECTALHVAAFRGNLDIVYELIVAAQIGIVAYNGFSVCNVQDDEGLTPLHYACSRLMIDVCKMLIRFGADTSTDHWLSMYNQPVLYAALAGTNRFTLPAYGFGPSRGIHGDGTLREMRLQVVKLLLDNGADVSNCEWCSCSAMIWEVAIESYTDTGLLELLLDAVEVTGKSIPVDDSGNTIMHHVAALNYHLSANGADIKMLEILRLHARRTQNNTLDISTRNFYGNTTLFFACRNGKMDTVRYLLDNGVDPPTECMLDGLSRVSNKRIWAMLNVEFGRREKERNLAFAMASDKRLGATSGHHLFPPEVMRIVLKQHDHDWDMTDQ
jgi:ankyrin repeat protein